MTATHDPALRGSKLAVSKLAVSELAVSELAGALDAEVCPAGLPVITARMLNDPHAVRLMREAGSAHEVNLSKRETGWLLTGYDAAARAMVDPRLLGDPPQYWAKRGESRPELLDEEDLFFLPEPERVRLRLLIARRLTNRRVAALAGRLQGQVDALLDAMPPAGTVNFVAAFARPLPAMVLCELLGIPGPGRQYVLNYVNGWIAGAGVASPVTESAGLAMAEYLKELVAARRSAPGDDLISAMAQGAEATDGDVLSAIRLLLVAGHRPVTRLLARGVAALLSPRSRWQQLVSEPERIEATVEELLRFITPTPLATRYVKDETEIGGVPLPGGSGVHCSLGAANRDPARFDDPDTFDPRRPTNPHLSFGLGRKHCLGAALVRAEARVAIGSLVRRFPQAQLVDDQLSSGRLMIVLNPASTP